MNEEENKRVEVQNAEGEAAADNSQYIAAISAMKQNTVSKEAFDKLKEENKQLLETLINNGQIAATEEKPKTTMEDVQKLRNKLADESKPMSNLEFVSTALELREALLDQGEKDPFLPWGHNISPTNEDVERAEEVAKVFKECIEYADGDSELFTNELMRRTNDAMPIRRQNNIKRR